MGTTTPNISIYIPAAGETNYDAAFAAGMVNIDQHDHSGGPTKGVPISGTGIADGSITFNKLAANVADTTTGIATLGAAGANQLSLEGLIRSLYSLGNIAGTGFISRNNTVSNSRTFLGTANQIAITNGDGAGNPVLSLPANVINTQQSAFLGNAAAQPAVTGDATLYTPTFAAGTVGGSQAFNQGSNFNGNTQYTAPITGIYFVHCDLALNGIVAGNTDAEISIYINGSQVYSDWNGALGVVRNSANDFILSVNQMMKLTTGDLVTIRLSVAGNGAKNIGISDGTFGAVLLT